MSRPRRTRNASAIMVAMAMWLGGCGDGEDEGPQLAGTITIAGSSSVLPFAEAAAEGFGDEHPDVQIDVAESDSAGAFARLCEARADAVLVPRRIEPQERRLCEKAGTAYGELAVALDAVAVVTNEELDVSCLRAQQLRRLWSSGSRVLSAGQLGRDGNSGEPLPDVGLTLYGPVPGSDTYDFITAQISGGEGLSRDDFRASEDDESLAKDIAADERALGYLRHSSYAEHDDRLNLVSIDTGTGCVGPSIETIQDGSYRPLSRELMMYRGSGASSRPEVEAFARYLVGEGGKEIAAAARLVPPSPNAQVVDQAFTAP